MEENKFYKEFNKLRLPDPSSRTGYESGLAMAQRLGIHNKTITQYKRGAIPYPQTVQTMVKAGGYNAETFQRLVAAAAQRDGRGAGESKIPIYNQSDIGPDGVLDTAIPIFHLPAPMELNILVSISGLTGIKLHKNDNRCEPRIPRGSFVVYSREPCDSPANGEIFVFSDDKRATPSIIRIRGREMWRTGENLDDLIKITRDEFKQTVLGKVVTCTKFLIDIPALSEEMDK